MKQQGLLEKICGDGDAQRQTILAAGLALKQAGVLAAETDVPKALDALLDPQYSATPQEPATR